ncbi:MAG: hypothetical protein Ct9H300mP1_11130 [Planctomycetaceae bacterium]|nr:MAG: hypothetical protein Ct9H300mP1_11130 [Planctomycetaceae bacterium]
MAWRPIRILKFPGGSVGDDRVIAPPGGKKRPETAEDHWSFRQIVGSLCRGGPRLAGCRRRSTRSCCRSSSRRVWAVTAGNSRATGPPDQFRPGGPATDRPSRELRGSWSVNRGAAIGQLVDRLVSSPHTGAWGRHWLDLARYPDSNGFEFDFERPNAWHYRDWVIDSLNDDLG